MSEASLAGNLPAGDGDGLSVIVPELIREPRKVHVVIALIDCAKITTKPDSGEVTPTARIRRIEVVTEQDRRIARQLLDRSLGKRTGRQALPFDLEQDLRSVFGDTDDDNDDST